MLCKTTREGYDCAFMSQSGCNFNGGSCHPAVEACQGCDRTVTSGDMVYCQSYPDPAAKWRYGTCNFATHVKGESQEAPKLNPLKASKRAGRAR
ncbi:MAG: PxxKW family cysteine-rich protein [Desulfarculaceae bacterium]